MKHRLLIVLSLVPLSSLAMEKANIEKITNDYARLVAQINEEEHGGNTIAEESALKPLTSPAAQQVKKPKPTSVIIQKIPEEMPAFKQEMLSVNTLNLIGESNDKTQKQIKDKFASVSKELRKIETVKNYQKAVHQEAQTFYLAKNNALLLMQFTEYVFKFGEFDPEIIPLRNEVDTAFIKSRERLDRAEQNTDTLWNALRQNGKTANVSLPKIERVTVENNELDPLVISFKVPATS